MLAGCGVKSCELAIHVCKDRRGGSGWISEYNFSLLLRTPFVILFDEWNG